MTDWGVHLVDTALWFMNAQLEAPKITMGIGQYVNVENPDRDRPQNAHELLQMVEKCRASRSWDNDRARDWWEAHLLELTGPLALSEAPTMPVSRAFAVV